MPMIEEIPIPSLSNNDNAQPIQDVPPITEQLPPKRKRQRRSAGPSKMEQSPPQPQPQLAISDEDKRFIADALTVGFGVTSEIIASRRGPHWKLTKDEAQRLGTVWAEPLAPILASNSKYVPWAIAALATVGVVTPRIQEDARLVKQLKEQSTGRANNGADTDKTE